MNSVCQVCILRSFCESTIYINQSDLILLHDMDALGLLPEAYIAKIKLAPSLNQVFQNAPFERPNFPRYSIGAARKAFLRVCSWN